jgi:ureidoglycolate hydrolase
VGPTTNLCIVGVDILEEPWTKTLTRLIPVLPLTYQVFEPFGQVIEAYSDRSVAPPGTRITSVNQRTATKFHNLAPIRSSYPANAGADTSLSVYRCKPLQVINGDGTFDIKLLERHRFTNQAFIPMGGGGGGTDGGDGLDDPGTSYLVVVAKNDRNGLPDVTTLSAFIATGAQGIMYNTAVWRASPFHKCHFFTDDHADHPMTCLGKVSRRCVSILTELNNASSRWTLLALRRRSVMEIQWTARCSSWIPRACSSCRYPIVVSRFSAIFLSEIESFPTSPHYALKLIVNRSNGDRVAKEATRR